MRSIVFLIKSVAVTLCIGFLFLFGGVIDSEDFAKATEKPVPIEEAPIINKDAVKAYRDGEITRLVAKERIESRLDALVEISAIQGWSYDADKYSVIMNNGAVFSYIF